MEKYILQILENNSRVIVPEFGAFIIKQKNPLVIVFNEFLQYNDGVLVDSVAKNEGIDRDTAKNKIDEFVKQINSKLDKGNSFVIDQLGVLIKSSTGKISLEKETASKPSKTADVTKAEKKTVQPKTPTKEPEIEVDEEKVVEKEVTAEKVTTPSPKKEEKKVETDKKDSDTESVIKEKEVPKEKVEPEKKEVEKSVSKEANAPPVTSATISREQEKPKVAESPQRKAPVSNVPPPEPTPSRTTTAGRYTARTTTPVREGKKRRNLWLWIIIILIVNGIIITYFIMSDQLNGLFNKTEEVTTPDVQDMTIEPEEEKTEDLIIVEPDEPIIEEEPVETEPQPAISGTRFYVVAGVFRDEQNADNLVVELKNQGYNSEKFGKIGNLYAVSFGVYSSREDAEREMRRIKQEENPEAWIKVIQ